MCMACSFPASSGDWIDAGCRTADVWRQDSALLALQALLATHGLTIRRGALNDGFRIQGREARALVARTVDDIWPIVRDLTGDTLDPLAPPFISTGR